MFCVRMFCHCFRFKGYLYKAWRCIYIFWILFTIIILGALYCFYETDKRVGRCGINERQIIIQIPVFECQDSIEHVVKTVINTYQKDNYFNFIPRINLIMDNTTEEQRRICRMLESEYDSIYCSYSRDLY